MAIIPEQIDLVAEEDGWFRPEYDSPPFTLILSYLTGELSLDDTVTQLTAPINAAYTSADSGNAIRRGEEVAAHQRKFHSEDKARELWGDPLPESEVPPEAPEGTPSAEGQLWELWYAVLHAAKHYPWRNDDNDSHSKLAALVAAIKRVPDPPLPGNATKALRNDWIWTSGTLWSTLSMLGPSARETWNSGPGGGFGFSDAEIAGWANVNAFVARLTAEDVSDYSVYAIWGMRDALEENVKNKKEKDQWLDATVPAAAAWIGVWGRQMYERREDLTPESTSHGNPWQPEWSQERWAFWKLRFEEISLGGGVKNETKTVAKEAFDRMVEIENQSTIAS